MSPRKKVAAVTLGCRLNQADTALLFGRLKESGYVIVEHDGDDIPDFIIVNTCAVTASASQKSRQSARALKKKFPESRMIVTGCDADAQRELWENEKAADVVLGNREKPEILKYLKADSTSPISNFKSQISHNHAERNGKTSVFKEDSTAYFPFRSRAFLKIQDGCNAFCSYCIVPHARGGERSRDLKEIFCEFRRFLDEGHKEIVITGVNTSAYKNGNAGLFELVAKLAEIPGDFRIRLSSTEPHPENKKLLELMKNNPKICRFLHLPLQHGTDEILKAMGRNYTASKFVEFAEDAFRSIPSLHLGTDVIVGFPGETKELFEKSCEFIKNIPFANIHIFRFSPRCGTPAAKFANQPPAKFAKGRRQQLQKIKEKLAGEYVSSQIGKILTVLTEKINSNGEAEGWSDNYIRIRIRNKNIPPNSLVNVGIKSRHGNFLIGKD